MIELRVLDTILEIIQCPGYNNKLNLMVMFQSRSLRNVEYPFITNSLSGGPVKVPYIVQIELFNLLHKIIIDIG